MHSGQRRPRAGPRHADPRLRRSSATSTTSPCRSSAAARAASELVAARAPARGGQGALHRLWQPYELRSLSLSTADVHVVGLARGLAGYVVPSRLYGVLAAGRPVIAAAEAESETAQLVAEVGCGVVVPPGDPFALARAIRAAHDGEFDLEEMGRRARAFAEAEADRAIAIGRYEAVLSRARARPRDRRRGRLLGRARRARLDARRLPARAAAARSPASGAGRFAAATCHADRDGDRRRPQRGGGDRAAAREPARARLPGRPARDRRHLRRLDDRTDELVEAVAAREPRVR